MWEKAKRILRRYANKSGKKFQYYINVYQHFPWSVGRRGLYQIIDGALLRKGMVVHVLRKANIILISDLVPIVPAQTKNTDKKVDFRDFSKLHRYVE